MYPRNGMSPNHVLRSIEKLSAKGDVWALFRGVYIYGGKVMEFLRFLFLKN